MIPVSKAEFFAMVGRLNVHPRVDASTLKGRYHVSHWEMQDGTRKVVGQSKSDSWSIDPTEYAVQKP